MSNGKFNQCFILIFLLLIDVSNNQANSFNYSIIFFIICNELLRQEKNSIFVLMKNLTVSIVTYHTDIAELQCCIESLQSPVVKTIYVVDNSSRDYIAQFCAKNNIVYIPSENVGYGAAHNKAMRLAIQAGSPYHLVINSDIYFSPSVLSTLIDYMDTRPDVAQVHPRVTYPDGTLQYTVRMLPTPFDLILRRFMPAFLSQKRDYKYLLKFANHDCEMNVPYHQGSFMLFRTDALSKVGLFDERFFMYPEDIDITRRMHTHYRTMYYPAVSIVHNHRAESYKSVRMLRIHIVNMIRYFNKWGWFCDAERRRINRQLLSELCSDNNKKTG